ncbi:hypothetical protein LXL04_015515 [Taraxacum kok-saghyz]
MITTPCRPRFTVDLMEAGGGDASLPVILRETGCKIAKVKLGGGEEEKWLTEGHDYHDRKCLMVSDMRTTELHAYGLLGIT